MALNLGQKREIVEDLHNLAKDSVSLVIANYAGVSANDFNHLRYVARENGLDIRVVKNTLATRALEDTDFVDAAKNLKGNMVYAFSSSTDNPGIAAKVFQDFIKSNQSMEVELVAIDNQVYGKEHLEVVASLPNHNEAVAKLAFVIKAPVTKVVRTLSETYAKLVRCLNAVAKSKES